jgi:hypothetical protein
VEYLLQLHTGRQPASYIPAFVGNLGITSSKKVTEKKTFKTAGTYNSIP